MPFPTVDRVIYNKNPLDKVICQFQFPSILKIDSELPYSFQEAISKYFPIYSEMVGVSVPKGFEQAIPKEIIDQIQKTQKIISEVFIWL